MSNSKNLVEIDPEKLGGEPLDQFLDQFPTVTREQALAVLEESKERLILSYESAA